jgi:hypothetical protein
VTVDLSALRERSAFANLLMMLQLRRAAPSACAQKSA